MINLELYRIFVTVANEGNITKASEMLHVSQPAITKQIKNLEDQLNIKLFERKNSGVQLTPDGNTLYFKIKDAIDLICKAENDFMSNRTIKVGARNQILTKVFSKGIIKFYNLYPNEKLDIQMYSIDEMLKKLNEKQLDVVLTKKIEYSNYQDIKFLSLGFLHDVFFTKYNSKYSNRTLSKEDLQKEIIYSNILKYNAISTLNLKKILGFGDLTNEKNIRPISTSVMIEILKKEDSIGFMTKEFIQEELDSNTLEIIHTSFDIEPTEYGIYYNKNNKFDKLNDLIDCIKTECENV